MSTDKKPGVESPFVSKTQHGATQLIAKLAMESKLPSEAVETLYRACMTALKEGTDATAAELLQMYLALLKTPGHESPRGPLSAEARNNLFPNISAFFSSTRRVLCEGLLAGWDLRVHEGESAECFFLIATNRVLKQASSPDFNFCDAVYDHLLSSTKSREDLVWWMQYVPGTSDLMREVLERAWRGAMPIEQILLGIENTSILGPFGSADPGFDAEFRDYVTMLGRVIAQVRLILEGELIWGVTYNKRLEGLGHVTSQISLDGRVTVTVGLSHFGEDETRGTHLRMMMRNAAECVDRLCTKESFPEILELIVKDTGCSVGDARSTILRRRK